MTRPIVGRFGRGGRQMLGAVGAVVTIAVAGCSGGSPLTTTETVAPVPIPLATSIEAAGGVWASLAMGHLNDPANTFWQLMFQPTGSSAWSDLVNATAVATNGGLDLASQGGASLLVGVAPSNLPTFSPLIRTSDGGQSWSNGLSPGLAADPDALAVNSSGRELALVSSHGTAEVVTAPPGLTTWKVLITLPALARDAAGSSCTPTALTAVAYDGSTPAVGATCAQPGVAGVFLYHDPRWQLSNPTLPSSLADDRLEVLGVESTSSDMATLLAATDNAGVRLITAWTGLDATRWNLSPVLPLATGDQLVSFGPAGSDGLFALTSGSTGSESLAVLPGPGVIWRSLPTPPAGTATIAFAPKEIDALAVHNTVLTVWAMRSDQRAWAPVQTLQVPMQFGSSG